MENVPQWVRDAKVGDEVVAIQDGGTCPLIKKGIVYTIREIVPLFLFLEGPALGFKFEGFKRTCEWGWDDPYCYENFKPVSKRGTETGMKVFREILDSAPVKQLEDVR